MRHRWSWPLTAVLIATLGAPAVPAATVKLATLAPDGSAWHGAIEELGEAWSEETDGRVRLRVYAGGVAGDDPDMVRKLRIGQLHAAALTITGLASIDPAFNVFAIPMFFASDAEARHVLRELTPVLRQRLEDKGFVLVHWGAGGWVHFFSKEPVRDVADLEAVKMFSWAGTDDAMAQIWKELGFRPVPLAATDVLTGLQTGLIDGLPATPLAALSLQWYRQTPYMLGIAAGPLVGATVMSRKSWDRIDEADRPALLTSARAIADRLADAIPAKDAEAVTQMRERGLTVTEATPEALGRFEALAGSLAEKMRGGLVPEEIFALAVRHRDAYRAEHGSP